MGSHAAAPAIYRTRITHLRRAPVRHYFEHRSYSWLVDLDALPRLPRFLRTFATFDAADHFEGEPTDTLRQRVDAFLASRGADVPGGRITAFLQARVMGRAFNPLSLFWCYDRDGRLRHVVAEMHNIAGERHAYLLPPTEAPVLAAKKLAVSPFHPVDGYYLIDAPEPGREVEVSVEFHRNDQPAFVATVRGRRRRATVAEVARLQLVAPLAPLAGSLGMRFHHLVLRLRRVPRLVPAPLAPAPVAQVAFANPAFGARPAEARK